MLSELESIYQLLILGVVQGFSELLPISSSGHLIVVNSLLNANFSDTFTLTALHLGTTISIVAYNIKLLLNIIYSKNYRFISYIALVSLIPAIVGVLFDDYISSTLRNPQIVALSLILLGIVFIIIEARIAHKKDSTSEQTVDITRLSFKTYILASIGQTLALIPGVSRSGATALAGISQGLDKYSAFKLSFILGIPILLGSFVYALVKEPTAINILLSTEMILAISVCALIGYLAQFVLERISKQRFLTYFGIYRIVIGVIVLLLI